jgi:hypothetical protein
MTEGWIYDVVIETREENRSLSSNRERERRRERESKSYPRYLKQINLISFLLLLYIESEESWLAIRQRTSAGHYLFLYLIFKKFNCRCADQMLSLIIILLLFIQHFHPTEQLKTIQATLASTVELPCSVVNQTTESVNAAKVNPLHEKYSKMNSISFSDPLDSWWSRWYSQSWYSHYRPRWSFKYSYNR